MSTELRDTLAAIRFGYGLTPARDHGSADALLESLSLPPPSDPRHLTPSLEDARRAILVYYEARRASRDGGDRNETRAARERVDTMARQAIEAAVLRAVDSRTGLRERLIQFWADHFALTPTGQSRAYLGSYLFDSIGGNVNARFADMLKAVAAHPLMMSYLDQDGSVGPNSTFGERRGVGLNENYARELIELHTLGIRGSYGQADVRQMAELLTGMTYSHKAGFRFDERRSEPGAEDILGRRYGGDGQARLEDIHAALEDLSVHPDTARHMARKLAVHFVSDRPDPDLVAAIEAAWRGSGGDLPRVYAALLEHPAAWALPCRKVKRPFDFLVSALRALGLGGTALKAGGPKILHRYVMLEMDAMGQPPFRPPGPDGWPERPEAWITPAGLATRIRWAMNVPGRLLDGLPDPAEFAGLALGPVASPRLRWAASVSETRAQGVALVLSSPEFNRR